MANFNRNTLRSEVTKLYPTTTQFGDVKTVARIYDCHPATVWRMVQRGEIEAPVKIGNLTRWDLRKLGLTVEDEAA